MVGIGGRLRGIRQQLRLSLREVEHLSRRIAQARGDLSYQVSASWLSRLESDEHELTVNTLIALGEIYTISTGQLIRSIYPENEQPRILDQISSRNAAKLPRDETTLLPTENTPFHTPYRLGIIGKLDLTLQPMVPAGSIVQIDTRKREISAKNDWTHEFQRPIYFVKIKDRYFCGWCELDKGSQWLTLIPHPLSSASSRRYKYPIEVENIGRVMSVVIRFAE